MPEVILTLFITILFKKKAPLHSKRAFFNCVYLQKIQSIHKYIFV